MQKINNSIDNLSDVALDPNDSYFFNFYVDLGVTGNFLKDFENKFPELKDEMPRLLGVSKEYYEMFLGTGNSLPVITCRKILLITQLLFHGSEAFGNKVKFLDWLYSKSLDLDGKRPIDTLKEEKDIKITHDIIGRIEYGVYS